MAVKRDTGALPTTPWARREPGGLYIGHDKSVTLYRELPLTPLKHEDPLRRLELGQMLEGVLAEIGALSKDIGQGLAMLSQNRSVHLFAALFDVPTTTPAGTPAALATLYEEMLSPLTASKTVLLGVKLRSSMLAAATKSKAGLEDKARALLGLGEQDIDFSLASHEADYREVEAILRRYGAQVPRPEALAQLEAWWNDGQTPDQVVEYLDDAFAVSEAGAYELYTVMTLPKSMSAPFSQWLLDAMSHPSPAVASSIRGDLEPSTVTRTRLRRQRRKLIAQEEEEAATGDLGREENSSKVLYAQDVESYVVSSAQPWLTNTSILLAHRVDDADSTFVQALERDYGIVCVPLVQRQLEGLDEMQPGSSTRTNPFPQDVNLAMVAHAGVQSFSNLGDAGGVLAGHVDPDFVPFYVDTFAAANNNKPPVMAFFGAPGSGKTFAAQLIAAQNAIAGINVFFVNPKGFDSLAPWADWVASRGVRSRTVSMSKVEERGGAFDPFSFCEPKAAAEILARHIQTGLGAAMTPMQEFAVAEALSRAAEAGARCGVDAIEYIADPALLDLIKGAIRSYTLFALAFSKEPRDDWQDTTGLTLIEFDRELPLPKPGKDAVETAERMALAALRLVSRAAMELLMRSGGGLYVIDEAHHYLNSAEGMASLDRLAREGRSIGLLPLFITQQPSDLLARDMEMYMSRVLCLELKDAVQARAALTLCGLEPTAERVAFLRDAGPRRGGEGVPGRPAMGIFRDLYDRHAVVNIGPVPEQLRLAMSTNRADREVRDAQGAGPSTSTEVSA